MNYSDEILKLIESGWQFEVDLYHFWKHLFRSPRMKTFKHSKNLIYLLEEELLKIENQKELLKEEVSFYIEENFKLKNELEKELLKTQIHFFERNKLK